MEKMDEIISKSLEDIDSMVNQLQTNNVDLSKSHPAPNPEEVSNDVPPEEAPQEGGEVPPQEGVPGDVPPDTEGDVPPEEGQEEEEEEEGYEKSLSQELNSDDNVRKALEVSEFLTSLVNGISTVLDNQKETVAKSLKANEDTGVLLAKSFQGLAKSQRVVLETQSELLKSIKSLSAEVELLKSQPAPHKSVQNSKDVRVIEKSFSKSLGVKDETGKLTKSMALQTLQSEFEGGNHQLGADIIALESTGDLNSLSPLAKSILNK